MQENYLLTIIPSVPYALIDGDLVFDRKFYDGIIKYMEYWPGNIRCVMRLSMSQLPDFDEVKIKVNDCPFDFVGMDGNDKLNSKHLIGSSIVLASADSLMDSNLSNLVTSLNTKLVYVLENILETRCQIIMFEDVNFIIKIRRLIYAFRKEMQRIHALEHADGLQANGVPAYKKYGHKTPKSILYFDTRVNSDDYISVECLEKRISYLLKGNLLRLSFSGRLIKMKGADHLIKLAVELSRRGLNYVFNIYGDGELKNEMQKNIEKYALTKNVFLHGAISFKEELIPEIKNNTDIFICCHRQSDPSCTYLETLSCGVPILGYDNKAFLGILDLANVGWSAPLDKINKMADIITYLNVNRTEIAKKSQNALLFSSEHCFEKTFRSRIDHLLEIVQQ